jgi:deoxyadenosine/deoxycytidine kinase
VIFLPSSADRLAYNINKRNRKIERAITRSYLEELSEAYNHYFFRYNSTPLLIVNSSDIDFVNSENDFDELFKQIFREDRGLIEYFNPEIRRMI